MYKVVTKYEQYYGITDTDTGESQAITEKDLLILMYFGLKFEGVAYDNEGNLVEKVPIPVFTNDSDDLEDDDYEDIEDDYEDIEDDYEDIEDDYEDIEDDDYEDFYGEDEDYSIELEETKIAKLYRILSASQIKLLKSYYLWFSRRLFTEAQKDPTFGMKSKRHIADKTASLNVLRNSGGVWKYAGFIDTGYDGGGYCTLGHKLRYMHLAWDVSKSDIEQVFFGEEYNYDIEQIIDTSEDCIIFGLKCISDFFEVDSECMASLRKAQSDSIKDMELMYDLYTEGKFEEVVASFDILDEILKVVRVKSMKAKLSGGEMLINPALVSYYFQFRQENMIVPMSLIYEIRNSLLDLDAQKVFGRTLIDRVSVSRIDYLAKYIFGKTFGNNINFSKYTHIASLRGREFVYSLKYLYLVYWLGYKTCGYYMYNGSTYSFDGGRSKEVKYTFSTLQKIVRGISGDIFDKEMLGLIDALYERKDLYEEIYKKFNEANIASLLKFDETPDGVVMVGDTIHLCSDITRIYYGGINSFGCGTGSKEKLNNFIADLDSKYKIIENDIDLFKSYVERNSKPVTESEVLNYLLNNDIEVKEDKFKWHEGLLDSIKNSGKEPSAKQMYYLDKLYTHITGKEVEVGVELKHNIADYPDYLKAIDYIIALDKKDFVYKVCKSVEKSGTFTDRQKEWLDKAVEKYNASTSH